MEKEKKETLFGEAASKQLDEEGRKMIEEYSKEFCKEIENELRKIPELKKYFKEETVTPWFVKGC